MDGIDAWRGGEGGSKVRVDEGSRKRKLSGPSLACVLPSLFCLSLVSCAAADPREAADDVIVRAAVSGVAVATSVG